MDLCKGVSSLQEQKIRSKYQKTQHNRNHKYIFINKAVVGAIHAVSCVDGGVARQQQLDQRNVSFTGGAV